MSKSKKQPVPDPQKIIRDQDKFNRPDTYTPYGNTKYVDNSTGGVDYISEFSPELKSLFSQTVDLSNPELSDTKYSDAYYDNARRLLDRTYNVRERDVKQSLFNRGVPEGSELYRDVYRDEIQDPRDRQYQNAAFESINASDQRRVLNYGLASNTLNMFQPAPVAPLNIEGGYGLQAQVQQQNAQAAAAARNSIYSAIAQAALAWATGGASLAASGAYAASQRNQAQSGQSSGYR